MDTWIRQLLCAAVVAIALASTPAHAQSCSDGNECTNPDMCSGGNCSGTPVAGSCDDGNPCTINDTCVSGTCQGTPNVGAVCGMTGCEGMCGPNGICLPDVEKQGQSCTDNLGECTTDDQCVGTVCFGAFKICPDADSNPCTLDVCNFADGQCMTLGITPCGQCETCNAEGGCVAANDGADCDDFNECTGTGTCHEGLCTEGVAVGTPTETPLTPAATNTATVTATETATGGATATSTVTPTDTGTPLGTLTDTPTGLATATDTPIATVTNTPVDTATDTPTTEIGTPTDTPTGIPTGTATATATGIPTGTATATATFTATGIPTGTVTATVTPTGIPTGTATATATGLPTGTATATVTVTATPTNTTVSGNTATVTATRTSTPTVVIPATSTATSTRTPLPVMASIIVGNAVGAPNTTTSFDVTLDTDAAIAGVQVDIAYPAAAPIAAKEDGKPDCAVNPAIHKDATSFAFLPSDCTPGEDCDAVRAIVLSIADLEPIPDGARLFTCNVAISAEATGEYPLACSNAGAGNTDGDKVGADCTSGTITVAEAMQATIVVSDIVGAPGQNATVTVSLETEVLVASTDNDITYPAGVGVVADNGGKPSCFVNPEIGKEATSFTYHPSGCTPGDDCTGVRALVRAASGAEPIPSGSILYTCEVTIGSEVAVGTYPLVCTNDSASDPDGNSVPTTCTAGDVIVGVQPITPTITPTSTPSVTPTATPTVTATPNVSPTSTGTITPVPTSTVPPTPTRTHKKNDEDDGCQVVAPSESGAAWLLLLPIAALLWRRRR
jgi:MYXO-CTERM domain-containing protein